MGPCLFHSGFSHETLNAPHKALSNVSCLLAHVLFFDLA